MQRAAGYDSAARSTAEWRVMVRLRFPRWWIGRLGMELNATTELKTAVSNFTQWQHKSRSVFSLRKVACPWVFVVVILTRKFGYFPSSDSDSSWHEAWMGNICSDIRLGCTHKCVLNIDLFLAYCKMRMNSFKAHEMYLISFDEILIRNTYLCCENINSYFHLFIHLSLWTPFIMAQFIIAVTDSTVTAQDSVQC